RTSIAAVDRFTGSASAWNPGADNSVAVVLPAGTTVYAGGAFGNAGGQSRPHLAGLSAGNGSASAWNAHPDWVVEALATDTNTIYVGGNFHFIGGEARSGFAAFPLQLTPPISIEADSIQRLVDAQIRFRVSGPAGQRLIVQGSGDL